MSAAPVVLGIDAGGTGTRAEAVRAGATIFSGCGGPGRDRFERVLARRFPRARRCLRSPPPRTLGRLARVLTSPVARRWLIRSLERIGVQALTPFACPPQVTTAARLAAALAP